MLNLPGPGNSRATHLVTFTVKAGGKALGGGYKIVSLEVRREVNRIPKATLVLLDGDVAEQTFAVSEEDTLVPGVEVEILGGYSSDEATLFKGVITRHRVEVGRHAGSRLVVELRDPVFRMTMGRRSRNFVDVTDADLLEQLIAFHPGLTAEVTPTTLVHPQIVQHQVSDWDFLVMRAEMAGLVVICIDGTVKIAPPAVAGKAASEGIFGEGLFSADLELDAESQLSSIEVGAWDAANQEVVTAEADDAPIPGPGDLGGKRLSETAGARAALRHPGGRDQSELEQWAAAEMGRARRAAVRGRVRVQGTDALRPGVLLELGGFGRRFDGLAFVSGVRHRLGRGDWTTEAVIGSDPRAHAERFAVAAPGAGGTIPPVQGLQIGVVEALEDDPAGEERIQVRLSTITATDGLLWGRHALPGAGEGRGVSLRPEIGDEVVIGFVDGDPRDPVILGALHSSAKPNPLAASDDNHEKAIITRAGMRIRWDDDKLVATIDTPAGNKLVLSEEDGGVLIEDQEGNRIAMGADGIALESTREIKLSATGDVKIEATNIELAAKASVKVEGSGGAELRSSGTTVVKGSLVTIN